MRQLLVPLSLALVVLGCGAGGKVSTIQITNDSGAPIFLQDFEWSGISIEGAAVVQDDACLNRCGLFQGNSVCAAAARLPTVTELED